MFFDIGSSLRRYVASAAMLVAWSHFFADTNFSLATSPVRDDDSSWMDNAELALKTARQGNKDLLLLFTGSDWCPPCQKLEEEVLGQEDFSE